jgi:hypothetical protein
MLGQFRSFHIHCHICLKSNLMLRSHISVAFKEMLYRRFPPLNFYTHYSFSCPSCVPSQSYSPLINDFKNTIRRVEITKLLVAEHPLFHTCFIFNSSEKETRLHNHIRQWMVCMLRFFGGDTVYFGRWIQIFRRNIPPLPWRWGNMIFRRVGSNLQDFHGIKISEHESPLP